MAKVFLYVEYQISKDFETLNIEEINHAMKQNEGLISKTWLSGVNTKTLGGFYQFDSCENAQKYIDTFLIPGIPTYGNLIVRLYNGEIVATASKDMNSPYFTKA